MWELPDFGFGRAGVVVGAGYGLAKLLPGIADYQEHLHLMVTLGDDNETREAKPPVVIASDKALPICIDHGVKPDYVVALNTEMTVDVELEKWFARVPARSALVLPVTAHPSHVRLWPNDVFWLVPTNIDPGLSEELEKRFDQRAIPRGSNSGQLAYIMAVFMGCCPVGLVGMTYAWPTLVDVLRPQRPESYEYHHFHNESGDCYTTLGFMDQRTEFLELVSQYAPWVKTCNCSGGGVLYSEDCERMDLKDFLGGLE